MWEDRCPFSKQQLHRALRAIPKIHHPKKEGVAKIINVGKNRMIREEKGVKILKE